MEKIPVYPIAEFQTARNDFYVNTVSDHLAKHPFVQAAHKHDFYFCVVFTRGSGQHEIDFVKYPVRAGSIFFLNPGQLHHWKLSADTEGYIFFHSRDFYDMNYQNRKIQDLPFYYSLYNSPAFYVEINALKEIIFLLDLMMKEYGFSGALKTSKLCSFIDLIYIDLARLYVPKRKRDKNPGYLIKLRKLESLIDLHYKEIKSPSAYADLMSMTGKHLNRIARYSLKKTVSEMIVNRILLEAKRMLVQGKASVSQIADDLGFPDTSYFNRLFKKRTGETPLQFVRTYQQQG